MKRKSRPAKSPFLRTLIALGLLGSFCPDSIAQDKVESEVGVEQKKEADVETSQKPAEVVVKKSETIKNLEEAFIQFNLSTTFGIIPGLAILVAKQKVEEPEIVDAAPETADTPPTETELKEKPKESKNKKEVPPEGEEPAEPVEVPKKPSITPKAKRLANCFIYYGYSFLLDSNAEAARNCFKTACALDPESIAARCYFAESLNRLCRYDELKEVLSELDKGENKTPFIYAMLAKEKLRMKKVKQALDLIESGLKIPGKDSKNLLLILKAKAYAHLGMGKATIKAYEKAAAETENKYVAEILLANSKLIDGDLKGCKEHIQDASKILPDDPVWQYKLGNYYASENNNTKAIEFLLSSTITQRLSASAYFNLANQYSYQGEFENALNAIHHIQKLTPSNATSYAIEGDIYKRNGKTTESIESYDEALKKDPTLTRVYYEIANVYAMVKRKDEAIATFEKAIQIMPDYWRIRFNYSEILWKLKLYDQAKEQCLKGINLLSAPDNKLNLLAKHYLSRGHAMLGTWFYNHKEIDKAIHEAVLFNELKYLPELPPALQYVKLRPERLIFASDLSIHDPLVQIALADMFYEVKDYSASEKHYRQAIKMAPENADLHSYLLNVLTHKNDWAGAAKENFVYSTKVVNKIPSKIGEIFTSKEKEEK